MPRPLWKPLAVAISLAALPPPVLHAALAATAGTLFEAAPFVLVAEAATGPSLRLVPAFAELAGCGCGGGRLPGALSLPATALAWLAFGPAVALGRLAAGLARAVFAARLDEPARRDGSARRRGPARTHAAAPRSGEAFTELAALVPPAFGASLAAQALTVHAAALHAGGAAGDCVAFGAGLLLGAVVPCATAGVAIAAALAVPLPHAAAGLLVTAGLLGFRPTRGAHGHDQTGAAPDHDRTRAAHGAHASHADATRPARGAATRNHAASLMLAAALAALAVRGPSGLVSPRLLPLALPAAALAVIRLRARRESPGSGAAFVPGSGAAFVRGSGAAFVRGSSAALIPALMAGALVAGVPSPPYRLDATEAAAAFPGSRLSFTGVALTAGRATVVERFAIACCRIDATPVSVTLDRRLSVPDGVWVTVQGTVARAPAGGLVLRPSGWQRVPRPADPFMYR